MIDSLPPLSDAPLNNYTQLHFALTEESKLDSLPFDLHPLSGAPSPALLHTPPSSDAEIDYSSRRMSSSAASDSSLQSRDKRSFDFSPSVSPAPKRARPDEQLDDDRSEFSSNSPRGVQLPSLASAFQDHHELRRSSLPSSLSDAASNRRLPNNILHRPSQAGLASYQFPPSSSTDSTSSEEARRLRLSTDTQIGAYSSSDYSLPSTALSSSSSLSFPGNSPLSGAPSVSDDNWASGIVRPSSTPSQVPGALSPSLKYDDGLRQSSQNNSLYGGVTRISGQHSSPDRARNALPVKSEGDWPFSSANFAMTDSATTSSPLVSSAPAISVTSSPTRSPQVQAPAASLVERPPRKRGKLPKPVTDYLKDWLHRHSDHPYPSEEEKKQLCNATGLSMSQVSNWMINARRRILAPAHRAAAGPQTNLPYATPARPVLDSGRRASMPADSLTLYHPMSLQSLPEYAHMSGTRHLVGLSRSMSSSGLNTHGHHPYAAPLDSYGHGRLSYGGGGALHPSSHVQGSMALPPASYLAASSYQSQGYASSNGYSRGSDAQQSRYTYADHAHSVSPQPGSGYNTPH